VDHHPDDGDRSVGERLAFALMTTMLIEERDEAQDIVLEITDDLRTNVEAISALLKVIRIELSWHAGMAGTSSLKVLEVIAEAFAGLPYATADDQPGAGDWMPWGPDT
jgi:hypothetical protein